MAKYRVVNTRFWDDTYVAELNPNEKLAFLYLLTNALTTIGGVYELSLKRAAFDVGLPIRDLRATFEKFEADRKIVRKDDWVGIVNFVKHQVLNPKVRRGIEIEHAKAPRDLVRRLNLPPEFFAIAYRPLSDSNRNSKSNSKGLFSTGFSPKFSTGDQEGERVDPKQSGSSGSDDSPTGFESMGRGLDCHAWVLMGEHVHLLVEIPELGRGKKG